jgi:Caspase domain
MSCFHRTFCFLVLMGTPCLAQNVPQEYRRLFARYVDSRSLPEKALNLVGLTGQDVGRSFALIAGVTRYPNMPQAERELKPSEADLRQLAAYLRDQEFFDEIVVLRDADMKYETLRYFLEVYFPERLQKSPKSRFLFAYSGHGITEGNAGYLLTSSARNMQDKGSSINLNIVRDLVDSTVEAGHQVLVLINACYSGAFLRRPFGPTRYVPKNPGAHAITAGGAKELTWHDPRLGEGSVFFEKLLAGLGGQADSSPVNPDGSRGDGIITVDELAAYLKQEIRISSDEHQNPMDGDISKNGSMGGFFFLNRQRQVSKGYVKDWNPARLSSSGSDIFDRQPRKASEPSVIPVRPVPSPPQQAQPETMSMITGDLLNRIKISSILRLADGDFIVLLDSPVPKTPGFPYHLARISRIGKLQWETGGSDRYTAVRLAQGRVVGTTLGGYTVTIELATGKELARVPTQTIQSIGR